MEPTLQDFIKQSLAGNAIPTDHAPSILDGSPVAGTTTNLTQDGKIIRHLPHDGENVVSLMTNREHFADLQFMNVLLTNACNLSCSYCYEQHNKDFGRFTTDSLRKAWDWLRDINNQATKTMQFFGGEPLIHQKLILDFLREHKEEIVSRNGSQAISITTNGLLLTKEFLAEYFSYPNTKMMISMDTIDASKDHREIGQEKINQLLEYVQYIMDRLDNPTRFSIRATISQENATGVRELWDTMYDRGVRQMVFHPLILSYADGYREWADDEWNLFTSDIRGIITEYPDDVRFVQIVEGVGFKLKTNCLTGSNTIAVDASGDFSGCYFFTNRKGSNTGDMLIGNIFEDHLFIDRFKQFASLYEGMFASNDQCKTCDLQGICYQCPAGNISTGEKLFRPDGMCQRLVELHLGIKHLILQNMFRKKLHGIMNSFEQEGTSVYTKVLIHLFFRHFRGFYPDVLEVERVIKNNPELSFEKVAGYFAKMSELHPPRSMVFSMEELLAGIEFAKLNASPKDLYFKILHQLKIGNAIDSTKLVGLPEDLLFVTLLHFVIANDSPFGMGG